MSPHPHQLIRARLLLKTSLFENFQKTGCEPHHLALVVAFVSVLSLQALRLTEIYEEIGVNMLTAQAFSLLISSLVIYRRFPSSPVQSSR